MLGLRRRSHKIKNIFAAAFLLWAQVAFAAMPFVQIQTAEAAPVCVSDTAGANDEPGQKDLTRLCADDAPAAGTEEVSWNWDDLGTSGGGQSMDACGLFDSDGDGNANFSVCVTTDGDPAVFDALTIYECSDSKNDRCTNPDNVAGPYDTACAVGQANTDPFPAGDFSPEDTVADCTFVLSDLAANPASLELTDVCSYPSQQPNSDPSDCVIIQNDPVALIEVVKNVVPDGNNGLFDLTVDGPQNDDTTTVENVGDNGTTGIIGLQPTNNNSFATVSETAGDGTDLTDYAASIACVTRVGGLPVAAGAGTTLQVPVEDGDNIICTITNTAQGSITIVKNAIPDDTQDFSFTSDVAGAATFELDDESGADTDGVPESLTLDNLAAGTYNFAELGETGWYLDGIECPDIAEQKDITAGTLSVTITAGQNITCTFTNRKLGQIIVQKQTNPDGDPQEFTITATGTNTIDGNPVRTITDDETETYVVRHGEYDVNETDMPGWSENDDDCQDLTINGSTPQDNNGIPTLTCTITNTKLATLVIVKDALPNHEQDFEFSTDFNQPNFFLDDDADNTLPSQTTFANLAPNQAYSVTELAEAGWTLTDLECGGIDQIGSTATVVPAPGQTVTCTFENTKLGAISGFKQIVNADSSFVGTGTGWTITLLLNGNFVASDVTDGTGFYSFEGLLPGLNYTLVETLLPGYTQIFGPAAIDLEAGEESTDNNFGNFENGSITGVKWNDEDGDGTKNGNETNLSGWTINITGPNAFADNDVTDGNGYSFTDLAPGTYTICEVIQAGWLQTFPANNQCHERIINISGETETADFGNQGRGTITVLKDVDHDGDGQVDEFGATDWTYDVDGAGDFATGTTQNVAAGTYTVSEDQQTDYHVTDLTCDNQSYGATESGDVVVGAGDDVICTFTNTRDTGTITVTKVVDPDTDNGLFNLQIDGQTAGTGADVSDGGTTGAVVVVTGDHTIGETAGAGTSLTDYSSAYICYDQTQAIVVQGAGTLSTAFAVAAGDTISCTITNTRLGRIIIEKQTDPDGDPQSFVFSADYDADGFSLSDGQQNDSGNLLPGTYAVSETVPTGWDLATAICDDQSPNGAISLQAGETVTCVFNNEKRAEVVVTKYNDYDQDGVKDLDEPTLPGWEFTLTDSTPVSTSQTAGQDGSTVFGNVKPGVQHELTETQQTDWHLSGITCDTGRGTQNDSYIIVPTPGQTVNCLVGNYRDAELLLDKSNDKPNATTVGDTVTYTLTVTLPEDSGALFNTIVTDLPPENFEVIDGSWTVSSTNPGHDVVSDIGSGPGYASPGTWNLGTMLPGEVITLTYKAVIKDIVSPGTYPDIAFARGTSTPLGGTVVLSNLTVANTPFVGTDVTVKAKGRVLGALVNTGNQWLALQFILPIIVIISVAALGAAQKKGAKA